jgi:hypothetical protein
VQPFPPQESPNMMHLRHQGLLTKDNHSMHQKGVGQWRWQPCNATLRLHPPSMQPHREHFNLNRSMMTVRPTSQHIHDQWSTLNFASVQPLQTALSAARQVSRTIKHTNKRICCAFYQQAVLQ